MAIPDSNMSPGSKRWEKPQVQAALWARHGCTIPLGIRCLLGRASSNDITLHSANVSRRHALIEQRDGAWWLEDLASRNGTFVNGVRVGSPTRIRDGAKLCFADMTLTFREYPLRKLMPAERIKPAPVRRSADLEWVPVPREDFEMLDLSIVLRARRMQDGLALGIRLMRPPTVI